jgi:class 3 adenylate cyclase/alpha-beta hydrolase superfamily lysophospholipase
VAVGDADIAYQVRGDGPSDLLYFYGLGSHIEALWDDGPTAEFLRRLASFSRLIFFDRRGTGASDGVSRNAIPTWEEWTEDIGAVLDAVGSEHTAILASIDGGPISILYAVAHPERVNALMLLNTAARYMVADDYPLGFAPEAVENVLEMMRSQWGTPGYVKFFNPSIANDDARADLLARVLRSVATPRTAAAEYDYVLRSVDVRQVLSMIRVPTIVFHGHHPVIPIEHGRYLAEHIDGARLVELEGADIQVSRSWDPIAEEAAQLLTGERPPTRVERLLTTLMFSDIVGSTAQEAKMGDHRWRALLDTHDRTITDQIRSSGGRAVKTTGDGFLASFDGPARAIRCAREIVDQMKGHGLALRVGLHTGECEVRGEDLGGLTVHIAARVCEKARSGEVLVSGTVKDLVVGSEIGFNERGEHELKGVPGSWKLFAVEG